jgi:hypothetical protein
MHGKTRGLLAGASWCVRRRASLICEVALQYHDGYNETLLTFANNINNVDGGTHGQGFKVALTRTLNGYARKAGHDQGEGPDPTGDDLREGLVAIVSVKLPDPTFNNQPKEKLLNPEVEGFVSARRWARRWRPGSRSTPPRPSALPEGHHRRPGPRGGAQGPRADRRKGALDSAARCPQAARLQDQGRRALRALPGRGRLGRRERQGRARRGPHAGHPAAQGQDPQRREGPHRQDAGLRGDPHAHPGPATAASARTSTSASCATARSSS